MTPNEYDRRLTIFVEHHAADYLIHDNGEPISSDRIRAETVFDKVLDAISATLRAEIGFELKWNSRPTQARGGQSFDVPIVSEVEGVEFDITITPQLMASLLRQQLADESIKFKALTAILTLNAWGGIFGRQNAFERVGRRLLMFLDRHGVGFCQLTPLEKNAVICQLSIDYGRLERFFTREAGDGTKGTSRSRAVLEKEAAEYHDLERLAINCIDCAPLRSGFWEAVLAETKAAEEFRAGHTETDSIPQTFGDGYSDGALSQILRHLLDPEATPSAQSCFEFLRNTKWKNADTLEMIALGISEVLLSRLRVLAWKRILRSQSEIVQYESSGGDLWASRGCANTVGAAAAVLPLGFVLTSPTLAVGLSLAGVIVNAHIGENAYRSRIQRNVSMVREEGDASGLIAAIELITESLEERGLISRFLKPRFAARPNSKKVSTTVRDHVEFVSDTRPCPSWRCSASDGAIREHCGPVVETMNRLTFALFNSGVLRDFSADEWKHQVANPGKRRQPRDILGDAVRLRGELTVDQQTEISTLIDQLVKALCPSVDEILFNRVLSGNNCKSCPFEINPLAIGGISRLLIVATNMDVSFPFVDGQFGHRLLGIVFRLNAFPLSKLAIELRSIAQRYCYKDLDPQSSKNPPRADFERDCAKALALIREYSYRLRTFDQPWAARLAWPW